MRLTRSVANAWRTHPAQVRVLLITVTFLICFGAGFGYGAWTLVCRDNSCPNVEVLRSYQPRQTSKLYAADGSFLAELGMERRTVLRLSEIPKPVRDAFVMTEDKRFYQHAGVDWRRFFGAMAYDVLHGGYGQGFSTITMQLARNIFTESISRQKTLVRKLKEAKVARDIETKFPKDTILELYLNQIYLGNGAYGVEAASERYFGKSARDLNLAEAATLAGLPKAPERYNPRRYPDRAVTRRNTVIELMRRSGAVTDAEASLARAYPLELARKAGSGAAGQGDIAPYFVEWVRQQLDAQFGKSLYEQGLKVYTTLDPDMQSAAERALEQQLRAIEGGKYGKFAHPTYEQYVARNASGEQQDTPNSPYLQGCIVALDPRTGAVRAMVGGRDFDDSKFNRCTQALRQPGSSFKPIVYADAIQNGRPPSYMVDDSPLSIPQVDGTEWSPKDADGKFQGLMTMRRGLYQSRNLVAIRVGMELGPDNVIDEARRFGITTPIHPYPSIYIGSEDVYPIELVSAYSAFANLGTRTSPMSILRVENARGQVLWEPSPLSAPVLSTAEAWLMVDMMKDVILHGTGFNAVWNAGFHLPAGGKSGTTNDGNDVWFIGYTADLVAGVWMGMDRPVKIKATAEGGILAAPAWTAFMTEVYRRKPTPPDWPRPDGLLTRDVDKTTGLLRNQWCPPEVVYAEWYLPGTEPIRECDVHSAENTTVGDTLRRVPVVPAPPPQPAAAGLAPKP